MPEFEFGQAPDEGSEFFVILCGQGGRRGNVAILEVVAFSERGVEFGLQEGEEEVEEVDAKGVTDCFESMD